ncbi:MULTISPECIES: hypothetical protein [unclassified Streptomyces]|uniref:hypothetical protein n=1 Tax=unclassified Streptomyces TaxID=2593676 RepID=UPI00368A0146
MTTSQHVRRTGLRVLVAGAAAAFLAAAVPVAATAATPHATAERGASAMRAAVTITCQEVDADLPGVFGRDCNSQQ